MELEDQESQLERYYPEGLSVNIFETLNSIASQKKDPILVSFVEHFHALHEKGYILNVTLDEILNYKPRKIWCQTSCQDIDIHYFGEYPFMPASEYCKTWDLDLKEVWDTRYLGLSSKSLKKLNQQLNEISKIVKSRLFHILVMLIFYRVEYRTFELPNRPYIMELIRQKCMVSHSDQQKSIFLHTPGRWK